MAYPREILTMLKVCKAARRQRKSADSVFLVGGYPKKQRWPYENYWLGFVLTLIEHLF